jgi:hypothetical protein
MYIVSSNGARIFRGNLYYFNPVNGATNPFGGYVPTGYRMQLEVYRWSNGARVGTTGIFNPCAVSQVPVTITVPSQPVYLNIDIDFTVKCSNKSVNIKPSSHIEFFDGRHTCTFITGGKGRITLIEGREYTFYTYYGGKRYSGKVTIGKNSSNIVTTGGIGISGTTRYNASTGRVSVLASYTINNCK